MLAISLAIMAVWCIARNRELLGGILLGLACAWKPHIGAPFVLYYLIERRWRAVEPAMMTVAGICALSLTAMQVSHVNWLHGWSRNVESTLAVGGVNDRSPAGPFRDEIIDLQLLLASTIHSRQILTLAAACVMAALVAWFAGSYARNVRKTASLAPAGPLDAPDADLLPLAVVAALSLLAVYHRVYDGALLTIGYAWALASLRGPRRRFALFAIALMCVFLIPFDLLNSVIRRVPRLAAVSDDWWWETFIVPHYAWGLFALTLTLLWTMSRADDRAAARDARAAAVSRDRGARRAAYEDRIGNGTGQVLPGMSMAERQDVERQSAHHPAERVQYSPDGQNAPRRVYRPGHFSPGSQPNSQARPAQVRAVVPQPNYRIFRPMEGAHDAERRGIQREIAAG